MKRKMSKKIILITLIGIASLLIMSIKSYAVAGFSVSPASISIDVGKTSTVNITATECAGKFTFESSDTSIVTIDKTEEFYDNVSGTITLTGKKAGTATITVTAENVADAATPNPNEITGSKTISVTVKDNTPPEPNFTSVNQTVYARASTNIRASYTTTSQSYGMLEPGQSVTRTGVGDNGWSKVDYNGKIAYIYSNNLTTTKPEETKSAEKSLKTLKITEGTLEPEFTAENTKYSVQIPNNVTALTIEAITKDEKSKVEITGNENLVSGSNLLKITVTAEDGTTRIYNLEAIKTASEPIKLSSLSILGINLTPVFSPDVHEYTVELEANSTVTDFAIQTTPSQEDATVEITGNSNFKSGENVVNILVKSKDGTQSSVYQITVNKLVANQTGLFTPENKKVNTILIIIAALVIIAIVIIIMAMVKKGKDEGDYLDDYPNPLKDDDNFDIDEDEKKERFTEVFKNQIMEIDKIDLEKFEDTDQYSFKDEEEFSGRLEDDSNYKEISKEEKNQDTMEMTRRFNTNYDYTLETYKKPKNTGKGKHF